MRAPKKEVRIDGYIARRRTNQANLIGWKVICPDGSEYLCCLLTPEEAVAHAKKKIALKRMRAVNRVVLGKTSK